MHRQGQKGFTLLEMIVAIGVFSVVMLIAVGALLSVVEANRKARALQSVLQNLDFALDSMVRGIRVGTTYYVDADNNLATGIFDQPSGNDYNHTIFAYEGKDGDPNDLNDQIVYMLNNGRIERSVTGPNGTFVPITSEEVNIEYLRFSIWYSPPGDQLPPNLVIVVSGTAGSGKLETPFVVQTNVTPRILDE